MALIKKSTVTFIQPKPAAMKKNVLRQFSTNGAQGTMQEGKFNNFGKFKGEAKYVKRVIFALKQAASDSLKQCCGSGLIESGSGIQHFKRIRIRI
jgi:hypothetical protein